MARQRLIGARNRKVTIQSAARAQDAAGGETVTWSKLFEAFGHVEPLRGREYIEAKGLSTDVSHRVTIPHRDGVTTGHRVLLSDGRALDIQAVLNVDERDRWLELMCVEHG